MFKNMVKHKKAGDTQKGELGNDHTFRFIFLTNLKILVFLDLHQSLRRLPLLKIMQTCPRNEHPLTPHFYIVKLGFTGGHFFLFLL